ncbi:hypothetical protein CW676_07730 [Macrococcoides caseolyticum]|uniref:hypothetical protein n=1 Tax=Macrococcoides caseolyticum TaxID=69966 RepID=UPI000C33CE72|nr:hypothetical protein [Macrococcus caseolyticus]PKE06421.1 hypothetical protein CW692_08280 [Macrococcus caseolyticus]PKE23544.1 hypothetical protein CW689_08360 [Macrococcus caseolyticus]PKE52882.1 hypothetical protein CW676_07730 [Macrococcus caseolyticus]PKF37876.1 hypothetical protein CW681_09615 [Macrococcus caseolyticus]PKF44404.1 hypothetical protein CW664_11065 [Macrococcus caseolyticus]
MAKKDSFIEEERRRKLDLLILFLITSLIISSVILYNKMNEAEDLSKDLTAKQEKREKIISENKKITEKQIENDNLVGNHDVSVTSEDFNHLYFDWNSWEMYSKNMKEIREKYPNLERSKYVDISGMDVGTGRSPESVHKVQIYNTSKQGEIAEIINQNRRYDDRVTERLIFKVSEYDKGRYDIKEFKVYNRAL